jgi:galactokinase/mevalonate kinase-like predicted kinase
MGLHPLIETIVSQDDKLRNRSLFEQCKDFTLDQLFQACHELEYFRNGSDNLYYRVRSSLFLYAIYRFILMEHPQIPGIGHTPEEGFQDLLERRFEEAVARFHRKAKSDGYNGAIISALATGYHQLAFQALTDQVRKSVRVSRGNQWMFRVGHVENHSIQLRKELLQRPEGSLLYPVLKETTPVRLDLSHSGWSDIFFLGMDYPEGARVLNISVNLGVYKRDNLIAPPIEAYVRAVPEPVLRVTSIDLATTKDIHSLGDLFNFGNDYLSLLKAGIIASGVIPPSFEGTNQDLAQILGRIVGPGMGLELVTKVNDIPKGSRLAVSTNLLAGMISALMRATGQTQSLTGTLTEQERRLVASRAILGEWLGGSGGGWQDSGGVWPGFKTIEGVCATDTDPEYGISRGTLLPRHQLLVDNKIHPKAEERLTKSLILFHGGMAQNVGPVLEMVTEKYLLRNKQEWKARLSMGDIFNQILSALVEGDIQKLAKATTRNFNTPLQSIIPAATNHFTETILEKVRNKAGKDFWGFQMLGGMSGGGMGLYLAPERQSSFRDELLEIIGESKRELEDALPFAMDPVVYNFEINNRGTWAELLSGEQSVMPTQYYSLQIPELVRQEIEELTYVRRAELDHVVARTTDADESHGMLRSIVGNLFKISDPASQSDRKHWDKEAESIRRENGFDPIAHEAIRSDLRSGHIGLSRNRLPLGTDIEDVKNGDYLSLQNCGAYEKKGQDAIRRGEVATLTLAAGMGTRWTQGAGVVKAINPFVCFDEGSTNKPPHRSFLEIHLAKSQKTSNQYNKAVPHLVSTSFLTHNSIKKHLERSKNYGYTGPLYLSPARSISQRFIPMVRDLMFLWQETAQEILDEQKQKVREAVRSTLMSWAQEKGEGSDYSDNIPIQRFVPPGHWYEIPNLILNGSLATLLKNHPSVQTLLLHNIDTLGVNIDPTALGAHLASGNLLTFEVIPRRLADRGGGLARVNGKVRLIEGLAQPREEDELHLSYYNTNTTWIQVDDLLAAFGLCREDLNGPHDKLVEAVRNLAKRVPTYVTIKEVKRRWGHGQEDVYPVAQVEKVWADMTSLSDVSCGYLAVPRLRGQQLKSPDEMDPWLNDGSQSFVSHLCQFTK